MNSYGTEVAVWIDALHGTTWIRLAYFSLSGYFYFPIPYLG